MNYSEDDLNSLPIGSVIRDHLGRVQVSFVSKMMGGPVWEICGLDGFWTTQELMEMSGQHFDILYLPDTSG